MAEQPTSVTPSSTPAAPIDPKNIASNISSAIKSKTNGAGANGKQPPAQVNGEATPADPNVGKEKYSVDGKEFWLTPEQARGYVQKGFAFEPKVTQLGHLQHEVGAFLKKLQDDPISVLTDKRIGLTPEVVLDKILHSDNISDSVKEKLGNWVYKNVVLPAKMSPEERVAAEKDKKLTEYERREQERQDEIVRQSNKQRADAMGAQLLGFVREAMTEAGLPDINTSLGAAMAKRTLELHRDLRGRITPKEAMAQVVKEMETFDLAYLDHLDDEAFVKRIGDKNAEKVKRYFLKLVKTESTKQPDLKPSTHNPGERRKTISPDDMHDYLQKLKEENAPTRFK